MSGMRATSPMKSDLARKIRTTAGKVDDSHPEMAAAGQHLRSAATLVSSGQHDGAKRHLDAAMELMTPRNLMRHGITDDEGHATAKAAMHQINVHRLGVMDVQDAEARNEQQASAKRDSIAQQAQQRAAKLQAAAAAKQATVAQKTAAKPTGTGPGSQQQTGPQPDPILATAILTRGGIELGWLGELRDRTGKWSDSPGGDDDQQPAWRSAKVRQLAGRYPAAAGHLNSAADAIDKGDYAGAKQHLTAAYSAVGSQARSTGGPRFSPENQAATADMNALRQHIIWAGSQNYAGSQTGIELAFNPAEARGKGGKWVHEGTSVFTYPGPAGSFEHARAVDRYASTAEGLPAAARALIRQSNEAMMSRDIPTALSRLAGARWHDANFGDGLHLADIDAIGASYRRVPRTAGVRNGPRNPLMRGQQHPGIYRPRKGEVVGYSNEAAAVELSAQTAVLERTPHPNGRPGGPGLYGKAGNKHSDYFEQIVHALMTKRGMTQAQASAIAWSRLRKWSAGGGNVHPEVRAAAAKALGQEQAAKLSNEIGLAYDPAESRDMAGRWVGQRVMFRDKASGKGVTVHGTVKSYTEPTGRSRYARIVIKTDKGDHVTRDVSTVKVIQTATSTWEQAARLIELACPIDLAGFNPAQPRVPAGSAGGGQFGGGSGGSKQPAGGKGTRAQRRAKLVKQAVTLRGEIASLLVRIHAATPHHQHSKSATPRKKGAAAVSAKAAAASKAAAAKSKSSTPAKAKAGTKTPSAAAQLTSMRARLAVLRVQLHAVMAQIHQLAGEERAAIELASRYSTAWQHEMRGPHGKWVSGGGAAPTATRQRKVARRAAVGIPGKSLHAEAVAPRRKTTAQRHGAEIEALGQEIESKAQAVQEITMADAERRARAAADAGRLQLQQAEKALQQLEVKKHRQKLAVHVLSLVAGAVLTWLAARLGSPELLTANLAPGALIIQELIDWRKRI